MSLKKGAKIKDDQGKRVLSVSNELTALIFSNSRNFEMEEDTKRKLKPN